METRSIAIEGLGSVILEGKELRYLQEKFRQFLDVNGNILIYLIRLLQALGNAGDATKFME